MSNTRVAHAKLTPTSDQQGVAHFVCSVELLDEAKRYGVVNAPADRSKLEFDGSDLNYLARVLYAEASGSGMVPDKQVRLKEKAAIIHVLYNRLNHAGYDPNNWRKGTFTTFKGVASAVKKTTDGRLSGVQFESVVGTDGSGTPKFKSVQGRNYEVLNKPNCLDFIECVEAVKAFISGGYDQTLDYDNFRAAGSGKVPEGQTVIGGNRFWKQKS